MWILIVEDEEELAVALRQGLEEQNHTVTVASDGAEALDVLEQYRFDAIVLDVMLPIHDGLAVARALRHRGCMQRLI